MGHTPSRWHESLLAKPIEPQPAQVVDLGPIAAKIYGGCMGLHQEVIDLIMDVLQDDMKALKACSLTCKAMFASTRRLVHQTLHLTRENERRIFTPEEEERYVQGDHHVVDLRFLSFMGKRDLLKYARRLNISIGYMFSPDVLEPHLQYFQSLDGIHTLTTHSYDALIWRDVYKTHFTQFYPTLTTLALYSPTSHYRLVLQFALQFPNLENLTLDSPRDEARTLPGVPVPPKVTQSPPLRGHLRCVGLNPGAPGWLREFALDLPNGINFCSVEFQGVHWNPGQQILDGCASSLEEFTIHIVRNECLDLGRLKFLENRSLRSIVLRAPFSNFTGAPTVFFWESLSTVPSPGLSEFVFELIKPPSGSTHPSLYLWGNWGEIDKLFRGFLDWRPDFKLVIRTGTLSDSNAFRAQTRKRFPLMAERDRITFETSLALNGY